MLSSGVKVGFVRGVRWNREEKWPDSEVNISNRLGDPISVFEKVQVDEGFVTALSMFGRLTV